LRTGFFAFWKSLKARGNHRLPPIPVFILYDVQSSQTADSLFNDLVNRLVVYLHRAIKKPMLWHRLG
ncbi:hypothetical protein, partial [Vibrio cholerae]|uniref:hypothetical protein n=1 Tax=Vibrio cholerae TaxID=666 RepID=UPI001C3EBC8D